MNLKTKVKILTNEGLNSTSESMRSSLCAELGVNSRAYGFGIMKSHKLEGIPQKVNAFS